jgi:NTE family protein
MAEVDMKSISRFALLFLLALPLTYSAATTKEEQPPAKRPSVGLVLEGGGALGLAHIGVLLWLEEHHIPVQYISGTSMGGLVGGFYATGNSAPEVREAVKSIPWDQVLSGQTPFEDLSFRRKQDEREYPNRLEFGLRKGLRFPEGFNSGQQVAFILDKIALPYSEVDSFNNLPTPFACVATDLVTNKQYVFRSGSLALALRSTMSLPGFFTPVRWNGNVFVDGGLLDNLPVDVAKEMGAQITLAIHLQTAPLSATEPLSSLGVLGESISTTIAANELRSMEMTDLLVAVPLDKYTSTDYAKADAIIQAGYDAANAKSQMLLTLKVDDATWQQYLADRKARQRTAPTPEFVTVKGASSYLEKEMQRELAPEAGKPLDVESLQSRILYLQGLGRFSSINYQMTSQNGKQGLLVTAQEKEYAPPLVRPLIIIDGSQYNNPTFSIGGRITFLDVGSFRSEWRNDLIFGSTYGLRSEYYHPFTPFSSWFIAPRVFAVGDNYNIYNNGTFLASYRRRVGGGATDVGYEFGNWGELRLGYIAGYESFKPQIGNDARLPTVSGRTGLTRGQFNLDLLDDPVIPRKGHNLIVESGWMDANPAATSGFPLSEAGSLNFYKISKPSSVYVNAFGGTTYTSHNVGIPPFSLGGSLRLAAYGQNELLTDQYYLFQTGYLRALKTLPPLLGSAIYLDAKFEIGKAFSLPGIKPYPQYEDDVVGELIMNTLFGPVMIGGAVGNHDHQKFFFRIGRLF